MLMNHELERSERSCRNLTEKLRRKLPGEAKKNKDNPKSDWGSKPAPSEHKSESLSV